METLTHTEADVAKTVPFAFFGTPYVARDTLASLLAAGYRPEVVITSPDAPRGRGLSVEPCATKEFALAEGIPVLTPVVLDAEFLSSLAPYGCRYAIVVAYGKLLPQAAIDAFPLGILNVHYSLLPKYRGAAPVEAALRAGDTETGVTIQRMVLKMDAGDILSQERTQIEPDETARELRPRLIALGSEVLIRTLPHFTHDTAASIPQDPAFATHAPKIRKDERLLILSNQTPSLARENWNTYRAYAEPPGTYFFATKKGQQNGQRLRVKIAEATYEDGIFHVSRIVPEGKPPQPFSWLEQNGWVPE
jgi:methionyl-tRNA formyltransferase